MDSSTTSPATPNSPSGAPGIAQQPGGTVAPAPAANNGPPPAQAAQSSPTKILVVDDEPDLELLIRQKFRKQIREGIWTFVFAGNGQQALEVLRENPDVDVILTDINMPVMDGLTLLLRLPELKALHKTVIVSAYGDLGNIRTAMNRGAFDFVTKPIDFSDLEITLRRSMDQLGLQKRALEEHSQLLSIRQELDIASNIQQSMLPTRFPEASGGSPIDLFAKMTPAQEVGGDFYDFFYIDQNRIGLVIGDVSGKGVSAAIFMAVTRTLIRATGITGVDSALCVNSVNRMLCVENPTAMFVTAFYGILNLESGHLDVCNAGHNTPYIIRADGDVEQLEGPRNVVLAADEDFEFRSGSFHLEPGDSLCLYTDGVTEAENFGGKLFGNSALTDVLAAGGGRSSRDLTQAIFDAVGVHAGSAHQSDDITALVAKWKGSGQAS